MEGEFLAILQCPSCLLCKTIDCFQSDECLCDECLCTEGLLPTLDEMLAHAAAKWELAAPGTFTQKDCAAMLRTIMRTHGDHT